MGKTRKSRPRPSLKNLNLESEKKYLFYWQKRNFKPIENATHTNEIFTLGIALNTEYLYWLFDVLTEHATSEMKSPQVQVFIKQWFHDEQGAKFMFDVFSVIRNDFGHVVTYCCVALFVRVS